MSKYNEIHLMAQEAIALQNKDRMDATLREISMIAYGESMKTCFEDKRVEQLTEEVHHLREQLTAQQAEPPQPEQSDQQATSGTVDTTEGGAQ